MRTNPPDDPGLLKNVSGSRDHLCVGTYDTDPSGNFVAPVSITANDGTLLAGTWQIPRQGATKAVIVCHGLGDSSLNTRVYSSLLLSNGFAVLVPDSRGHGGSGGIIHSVFEKRVTLFNGSALSSPSAPSPKFMVLANP